MVIFGTALLAGCYLAGLTIGNAIAALIGVKTNVGGVGIAMLLLIYVLHRLQRRGLYPPEMAKGVTFWAALYIPIVVAMASTQNVLVAVRSGKLAVMAAGLAFGVCIFLIAGINRLLARRIGPTPGPDLREPDLHGPGTPQAAPAGGYR